MSVQMNTVNKQLGFQIGSVTNILVKKNIDWLAVSKNRPSKPVQCTQFETRPDQYTLAQVKKELKVLSLTKGLIPKRVKVVQELLNSNKTTPSEKSNLKALLTDAGKIYKRLEVALKNNDKCGLMSISVEFRDVFNTLSLTAEAIKRDLPNRRVLDVTTI